MNLPVDMQHNLLSIFTYIMEDKGIGDFWREKYTVEAKMEFIEKGVDMAVIMLKIEKKFAEARKK